MPYLSTEDVVSLGRVCTRANSIAKEYLRVNCIPYGDGNEVEVNETSFSISDFLRCGRAATRIYINNCVSGCRFFEDDNVDVFGDKYGKRITHLRIFKFSVLFSDYERRFFERLENLEALTIETIDFQSDESVNQSCTSISKGLLLLLDGGDAYPNTIFKVRTLRFVVNEEDFTTELYVFSTLLPYYLLNLEILGHAFWPTVTTGDEIVLGEMLELVLHLFIWHGFRICQYDMQCFNGVTATLIRSNEEKLCMFLRNCWRQNIGLVHVDSAMFEVVDAFGNTGTNVVSLKNIHSAVQVMQLSSLCEVNIKSSCSSIHDKLTKSKYNNCKKLEKLNLILDSVVLQKPSWFNKGHLRTATECTVDDLIFVLFKNCRRENLKDLGITFDNQIMNSLESRNERLPVLELATLSWCCPNLTKLYLCNWLGTNKCISIIWTSLNLLEDVCFEDCANLEIESFVGSDINDPCCLKLRGKFAVCY